MACFEDTRFAKRDAVCRLREPRSADLQVCTAIRTSRFGPSMHCSRARESGALYNATMRKQRGTKLLELVVVMAIICILMAFYLPALVSAKRKAQQTSDYLSGKTTPPGRRSYSASDFVAVESPDEGTSLSTTGGSTGGTTGDTTGGSTGTTGGSTGGGTNRKTSQTRAAISPN